MDLDQAAMVAWVRSVEEADPEGGVLREADRLEATRGAASEREREAFLAARAGSLGRHLEGEWSLPEAETIPGWIRPALILFAFLSGVVVDRLEGGNTINVLSFPLIGLLLWNLLLYGVMVVGRLRGRPSPGGGVLVGWMRRLGGRSGSGARERYRELMVPLLAGKEISVMRSALHFSAAAAALGVLAGMYWRGLATEYSAAWESTFLSADVAGRILGAVLWIGSTLTGIEVPELREEAFSKAETASWIHLFAATALAVIVVPRVLLGVYARVLSGRAGGNVALDGDGWAEYESGARNVLRGGTTVVEVVPFASELSKRGREDVRRFAVDRWGGGAVIEFLDVVAYGDEDGYTESLEPGKGGVTVVVCQLTATPEDEVQGQFLRGVSERVGGEVLLLVEGRGFGERFGRMAEFEKRLGERKAAWSSVIRGDGFETVFVGGEA